MQHRLRYLLVMCLALCLAIPVELSQAQSPKAVVISSGLPDSPPDPMNLIYQYNLPVISPQLTIAGQQYIYKTTFGNYTFTIDILNNRFSLSYIHALGKQLLKSSSFLFQENSSRQWLNVPISGLKPIAKDRILILSWNPTVTSTSIGSVNLTCSFSEQAAPKFSIKTSTNANFKLANYRWLWNLTIANDYSYLFNESTKTCTPLPLGLANFGSGYEASFINSSSARAKQMLLTLSWTDLALKSQIMAGGPATAKAIQIIFPLKTKDVDPTLVGTSTDVFANAFEEQDKTLFMNHRVSLFYSDGVNMGYRVNKTNFPASSSQWSNFVAIRACVLGSEFSVTYNGSKFAYVWLNSTVPNVVKFRLGTMGTDGNFSWVAAEQSVTILSTVGTHPQFPTIAFNSSGYAFIAYEVVAGFSFVYFNINTKTDGTWADAGYALITSTFGRMKPKVWAMATGKMYFTYITSTQMLGKMFNKTLGGEEVIDNKNLVTSGQPYSGVSNGDNLYLAVTTKRISNANYTIDFNTRNATAWKYPGATTNTEVIEIANTTVVVASLSVDASNGDVYAFWEGGSATSTLNKIVMKKRENLIAPSWSSGYWSDVPTILTGQLVPAFGRIQSLRIAVGDLIPFQWMNKTSSPYDICSYFYNITRITASWHHSSKFTFYLSARQWQHSTKFLFTFLVRKWNHAAKFTFTVLSRQWSHAAKFTFTLLIRQWNHLKWPFTLSVPGWHHAVWSFVFSCGARVKEAAWTVIIVLIFSIPALFLLIMFLCRRK